MRLAGVTAADARQYELILYALTDQETARGLRAVVDRFDAAFDAVWQQALPELERAISEQASIQSRPEVALTITRAVSFYGAEVGAHPRITFEMLFRPEDDSPTYATQVLDRGLIEVVRSEIPALRIQVPVHEMFHFLFAAAPYAKLDELALSFAASSDPNALAAYGLLDEVLATGLAQGVLGRKLAPAELEARLRAPKKLYADAFVDAVTKALLPSLEELMARTSAPGAVFSPEFHSAYLAAVALAYPRGLPPLAHLRPLACAYAKELEKAYQALHAGSRAQLVGSSDEPDSEDARALLEERSTWGRVLLLKSSQLSGLKRHKKLLGAGAVHEITQAARSTARFAHASRSPRSGPVFVLVADDEEQAERLVASFISLDAMFSGIALGSPRESTSHGDN